MSRGTYEPGLQLFCQTCESSSILQDDEPFSASLADTVSLFLVKAQCPVMSPT